MSLLLLLGRQPGTDVQHVSSQATFYALPGKTAVLSSMLTVVSSMILSAYCSVFAAEVLFVPCFSRNADVLHARLCTHVCTPATAACVHPCLISSHCSCRLFSAAYACYDRDFKHVCCPLSCWP